MSEISVHVKDKHTCGHTHEAIFHMKEANFEGREHVHYSQLDPINSSNASFSAHAEVEREHTLEFTGSVERVEMHMCACCGLKPKRSLWRRLLGWIKQEEQEPCIEI